MSRSTEEEDSTKSRGRSEDLPRRWSAQRKVEVVLPRKKGVRGTEEALEALGRVSSANSFHSALQ